MLFCSEKAKKPKKADGTALACHQQDALTARYSSLRSTVEFWSLLFSSGPAPLWVPCFREEVSQLKLSFVPFPSLGFWILVHAPRTPAASRLVKTGVARIFGVTICGSVRGEPSRWVFTLFALILLVWLLHSLFVRHGGTRVSSGNSAISMAARAKPGEAMWHSRRKGGTQPSGNSSIDSHRAICSARLYLWACASSGGYDGSYAGGRGASISVHTLTCCTHIFLVYIHCAYTSHILHACDTHAWLMLFAVRMSSLLTHLLLSHVSPVFAPAVFDGHFETTADYDLTDFDVHDFLPNFPDLKAQVKRTPPEDELFGYLAKFLPHTGYEPKEFDKITSVDIDTILINDPNHDFSDFSKTHEREHWPIRCSYSVWILSFARFSWVMLFLREKAKKACNRETVARQRKRRERRFFVISAAESKSMKNRRNSVRSHSLQTHKEFYSDERDLRGHLQWRAQQVTFGENSVQRKSHSTEYDMEIQNLERRNSEYALFDSQRELEPQRLQLLEEIHWTEIMELWTHFCSELKMKNHPHQKCHARSCREFDELRRCCYQEEILKKTTEDWKNPTQHDQESRTVSPLKTQNLLWSWLNEQLWHTYVPHHALITSSSRKPSHEVGMPRNTRENMSIPGNVLDRPHAQRYSDELHNYSRNLAFWVFWEQKELRKLRARNHCNHYLYLVFQ